MGITKRGFWTMCMINGWPIAEWKGESPDKSDVQRVFTRLASRMVALLSLSAGVGHAQGQSYTFDTDVQGWRIFNIPFLGNHVVNRGPTNFLPAFDTTFGLPAPSLRVADLTYATWIGAPATALGSRPELFGQSISFDILFRIRDSSTFASVGIEGLGQSLWIPESAPELNVWLHRRYLFVPGLWRIGSINGPLASANDLRTVLSTLTGIFILTEWHTGTDDTSVDNVLIGHPNAIAVTSSQFCTAFLIAGSLSQQLSTLNAGPPPYNPQTWLPVWRHQGLHAPASFTCGNPAQNQAAPYISTEAFLNGADEVTYNNCGSAFYRFTFELPIGFSDAALSGVANVDDIAVAWLNGNQISATMLPTDAQIPVLDRTDALGRRVLNWPTTDPIGTINQSHFRAGTNELVFAVCGDATEFEPTGLEFTGTVSFLGGQTACYPNCDASTTAPVLNVNDFICFQNRFAAGDTYANCDGSTAPPILNVSDYICFLNAFAAGCP